MNRTLRAALLCWFIAALCFLTILSVNGQVSLNRPPTGTWTNSGPNGGNLVTEGWFQFKETGGTRLRTGAVPDGYILQRSGTNIVGVPGSGAIGDGDKGGVTVSGGGTNWQLRVPFVNPVWAGGLTNGTDQSTLVNTIANGFGSTGGDIWIPPGMKVNFGLLTITNSVRIQYRSDSDTSTNILALSPSAWMEAIYGRLDPLGVDNAKIITAPYHATIRVNTDVSNPAQIGVLAAGQTTNNPARATYEWAIDGRIQAWLQWNGYTNRFSASGIRFQQFRHTVTLSGITTASFGSLPASNSIVLGVTSGARAFLRSVTSSNTVVVMNTGVFRLGENIQDDNETSSTTISGIVNGDSHGEYGAITLWDSIRNDQLGVGATSAPFPLTVGGALAVFPTQDYGQQLMTNYVYPTILMGTGRPSDGLVDLWVMYDTTNSIWRVHDAHVMFGTTNDMLNPQSLGRSLTVSGPTVAGAGLILRNPDGLWTAYTDNGHFYIVRTNETVPLMTFTGAKIGINTLSVADTLAPLHVDGAVQAPSGSAPKGILWLSDIEATSIGLDIGIDTSGVANSWFQSRGYSSTNLFNLALNPLGGKVSVNNALPTTALDVTGIIRSDGTIPNEADLGTIANGGTITFVAATNHYRATLAGATFNFASFPAVTSATQPSIFLVYSNSSGVIQEGALPQAVWNSGILTNGGSVNAVTNQIGESGTMVFTATGGAFVYVSKSEPRVSGGSDDQTAAEVPFTPTGTIAATDVQAAIAEVANEAAQAATAVTAASAASGSGLIYMSLGADRSAGVSSITIGSLTNLSAGTLTATGGRAGTLGLAVGGTSLVVTNDLVGIGTANPISIVDIYRASSGLFWLSTSLGTVSHGMSNYLPTNSIFAITREDLNEGGAYLIGANDAGGVPALGFTGVHGVTDPTDSVPAVVFRGAKKNGANIQSLGNAETVIQFKNNTTDLVTVLGNGNVGIGTNAPSTALEVVGVVKSSAGFSSAAINTAVNIATTGWTNIFGKNAVVMLEGVGVTYTIYNNAGTAVYTNVATVVNATIPLQVSGKVIVTAGTGVSGTAFPW